MLYQTFEQMREDGTIEQIVHKYLPSYEFPEDLKPGAIAKAKAQTQEMNAMAKVELPDNPNIGLVVE